MAERYSDKAALRGEPGYVWRSGQERRLNMIRQHADVTGRILDNGCGLGTYLAALAPYSDARFGIEVEAERAVLAAERASGVALGIGERLPFAEDSFDFVLSNEVIEHVEDDRRYATDMVRVTRPGGRIVVFCPNRWYPVEQHGIFWRGDYKFGNIPFVNYLPLPIRNRLAPHVRTYTARDIRQLFRHLPVEIVHHTRIFGGYDNIEVRWPRAGRLLKRALYAAEKTPFRALGISHLLVLQKQSTSATISYAK
ncbi:MAG: methyltransferase domain-containing protein [Chloroflexota bacterium]